MENENMKKCCFNCVFFNKKKDENGEEIYVCNCFSNVGDVIAKHLAYEEDICDNFNDDKNFIEHNED